MAAETPEEVFAQIDEVDAAIARVTEQAKARQGSIVTLQGRVAELSEVVATVMRGEAYLAPPTEAVAD